jgi:molybdopterin synthase catalytic subunit
MIRVQEADFDVGAELAALAAGRPDAGALAVFVGLVRADGDPPIEALTLEYYPGMTERQLARIEAEAGARWPLANSLVIHRFGRLAPGARIVLAATLSAHRQAAFDACRFLVDYLKSAAPFWKREETPAGPRWVEASPADEASRLAWPQAADRR